MSDHNEDDPPNQPDAIQAYVLRALVELKASMAVLEARLDAQERLILATALALPIERRLDYLELATALQVNAMAVGDASSAKLMTGQLDRWKIICGDDLQAPQAKSLLTVHSESLLHAAVPKHLKQAQNEWLAIATPEEIAQELSELLSFGRAAGAGSAEQAQKKPRAGVRRKKKPGGV